MAIYIPGWYEQMAQSGNIRALGDVLGRKIAPDFRANQDLQQMIQQNPQLMEQFSNMDDGTRALIQQSLGYRNQTPITNLPVGSERKQRELMQGLQNEVLSDPKGRQDFLKKTFGKRTEADITNEQLDIEQKQVGIEASRQGIDINKLNAELLGGKVKDMKRVQSQIDAAMQKYPDLSQVNYRAVVRDFIRTGRPIDPALMTASVNDEGAKALLDLGIKSELMSLENEYAIRLRTAKDPNTSMLLLRTLTEQANQLETTQQRLLVERSQREQAINNPANSTVRILRINAAKGSKEAQKQLDVIEAPLRAIDKAMADNMQAMARIQQRTEMYGEQLGLPKLPKPNAVDPLAQSAYDAIAQRPDAEARIRASYKARTGKDLP